MNKIFFEDCLSGLKKLDSNSINLCVTSPPYADATEYGKKIECFKTDNYNDWFLPIVSEIGRVIKDDGSFILNINDKIDNGFRSTYVFDLVNRITKETNLKLYERYIWYKKSGLPTGGEKRLNDKVEYLFHFTKTKNHKAYTDRIRIPYSEVTINRMKKPIGVNDVIKEDGTTETNLKLVKPNELGKKPDGVMRFNTAGVLKGKSAGLHPAAFHPDLPHLFIEWLTDEGDLVLDPFMGTGTVASVAKKKNRNYIGFELNESYRDIQDIKLSDKEIESLKLSPIRDLFTHITTE
jgi:site-specific DNA-methyltransferase (adenine-specific)